MSGLQDLTNRLNKASQQEVVEDSKLLLYQEFVQKLKKDIDRLEKSLLAGNKFVDVQASLPADISHKLKSLYNTKTLQPVVTAFLNKLETEKLNVHDKDLTKNWLVGKKCVYTRFFQFDMETFLRMQKLIDTKPGTCIKWFAFYYDMYNGKFD